MRILATLPQSIVMRSSPIGECAVALDKTGRELAYYPARWNARIPTIRHATWDARWMVRESDGSFHLTATAR